MKSGYTSRNLGKGMFIEVFYSHELNEVVNYHCSDESIMKSGYKKNTVGYWKPNEAKTIKMLERKALDKAVNENYKTK